MDSEISDDCYTDLSEYLSVTISEGDSQSLELNDEVSEDDLDSSTTHLFSGSLSPNTTLTPIVNECCEDEKSTSKQSFASIFNRFGPGNGKKCQYCGRYFSKVKFYAHLRTHTGEKPYTCQICYKTFSRRDKLNSHERIHSRDNAILQEHATNKYHVCFCGAKLSSLQEMQRHTLTHNHQPEVSVQLVNMQIESPPSNKKQKNMRTCPYCFTSFPGQYKLSRHIRIHTGFKPYQCCCGVKYTRTEHLKKHQIAKNCDSYTDLSGKEPHILPSNIVIKQEQDYQFAIKHPQSVSNIDRGFACEYCGKFFPKSYKLNLHRRTHTGERPYQCETCGKGFARKDHLIKHRNVHLKYRKASNDFLKATISSNVQDVIESVVQNFSLNIKTEEADALEDPFDQDCSEDDANPHDLDQFVCPICGDGFKKVFNFETHLDTHAQRTLYKCAICSRAFKLKCNFEAHLLNHETPTDPLEMLADAHELKSKRCQCPICHKWLVSRSGLAVHIRSHTGEKSNPCDLCDKFFVRKADMMRHRKTHTGENMFQCVVCPSSYTRKDKLALHVRKNHPHHTPLTTQVQ